MARPFLGRFGAKWKSPQTSPIDSHVKSIFTKQGSQCNLYGFREGSPHPAFVLRDRKRGVEGRGVLFRSENRPRPLPLTPMLNPFSQNRALNAISMASGRARPTVLSSY